MATKAKICEFHPDHAACVGYWTSLGVRNASVLHIDMHHDLDPLARGCDEGNFLRETIKRKITSCVTWVIPLRREMMTGAAARTFLGSLPSDAAAKLQFSDGIWTTEVCGARVDIAPCDGFLDLRRYDVLGLDLDVFYNYEFGGPLTPPDWLLAPLQTLIKSAPAIPVFICSGLEDGYVPATFAPLFDDFSRTLQQEGLLQFEKSLLTFTQLLEQMRLGHIPFEADLMRERVRALRLSPSYRKYFHAWIYYLEGGIPGAAALFAQSSNVLVFHPQLEALAAYRVGRTPCQATKKRSEALTDHWSARRQEVH